MPVAGGILLSSMVLVGPRSARVVQFAQLARATLIAAGLVTFAGCARVDVPEGGTCATVSECAAGLACLDSRCTTPETLSHPPPPPDEPACTDLLRCQEQCPGAPKTSLTGHVFAPNGWTPLYNAVIYVPLDELEPFPDGLTCDRCGALPSGTPLVGAVSGPDGSFTIENAPAGGNIPLVIQVGRWRRRVSIPNVRPCQVNELPSELTRLPRNQREGDLPKMAIATGEVDRFECLLLKLGVSSFEFTPPTGTGRVHVYRANGLTLKQPVPDAQELWSSLDTLKKYDVVILPCEGAEFFKPASAVQNLVDYANAGGRVFASHFSYVWLEGAPLPFGAVAQWQDDDLSVAAPVSGSADTTFPKGKVLADWLQAVHPSPQLYARVWLEEPRHNLAGIDRAFGQPWVYAPLLDGGTAVQQYAFNTPVLPLEPDGGQPDQCGRVVYSNFHVTAEHTAETVFPAACSTSFSQSELELSFLFFDLTSCIQRDEIPPLPPGGDGGIGAAGK